MFGVNGAQEKTRTSTSIRTLAPEASASTNSATWAGVFGGAEIYPRGGGVNGIAGKKPGFCELCAGRGGSVGFSLVVEEAARYEWVRSFGVKSCPTPLS